MGSTDTQPQGDEVGLTVSPAYAAGMFGDLYGDLLSLIKPALDEMVCEGFAVGWQIDMVKRDYVEFRRRKEIPSTLNQHNTSGAELRRDLLALLVTPHTVSEAHSELGGNIGTLKAMVTRMAARGELRRVGRRARLPGVPGQPERVWLVSSACVGDVDPNAWL